MLAGRVAQSWLQAVVTRISSGINSSSSSLLPVEPLSALVAGFQQLQYGVLHTSSRCSQAHEDGGSSSSSSSTTGSTPGSSAAGDSSTSKPSSAVEGDATQEPKQNAAGAWGARFATVSERFSGTGYPESFLQTTAQQQQQRQPETAAGPSDNASTEATTTSSSSSSDEQQQQRQRRKPLSAGVQLPPEVLRVPLTQEAQQEQAEVTVDAYSLSRSLVADASPGTPKLGAAAAASEQQAVGRDALTSADKEALEKLVGILTKDGKKSRARRLLLDAMHIIQQQLAQGKGSA